MFEHYRQHRIATRGAEIFTLTGGSGPPLLLLHGYPQTHVMWHAVAPHLQNRFSLVLPDLRGYGDSVGPPPDGGHVNYSKRVMAADMIEVMGQLGYERFFVAGHDRGARVAYRLALDHPKNVIRLAIVDVIPTFDMWDRMDGASAKRSYHWLLLSQPAPLPERLIGCDPDFFLEHIMSRWAGDRNALDPTAVAEYLRHFRRASVIEAACEDYRAGASVDLDDDSADLQARRRIACPTLVLWARRYLAMQDGSPLKVWRSWADDVREVALDCGHFIAEEQPRACASALAQFFASEQDDDWELSRSEERMAFR